MITTIIFDIGRVLITYDWRRFLDEEFADPQITETLYNAFFGHGVWNETDRGVLSEDEMVRAFAVYAPGHEDRIRHFLHVFATKFAQQPYAKEWIRSLKAQGLKVYYLSNYSLQALAANPEVLDFTELMDGGIFSCHVNLIKPDPAIYQCICDKYGLVPAECVFIDDKQVNIDAAIAYGMEHSFVFRGYEDARAKLAQRIGGEPSGNVV